LSTRCIKTGITDCEILIFAVAWSQLGIYKKYSHFSRRSDGDDDGDSANKMVFEKRHNELSCPVTRIETTDRSSHKLGVESKPEMLSATSAQATLGQVENRRGAGRVSMESVAVADLIYYYHSHQMPPSLPPGSQCYYKLSTARTHMLTSKAQKHAPPQNHNL
jgi:hypothetical protein